MYAPLNDRILVIVCYATYRSGLQLHQLIKDKAYANKRREYLWKDNCEPTCNSKQFCETHCLNIQPVSITRNVNFLSLKSCNILKILETSTNLLFSAQRNLLSFRSLMHQALLQSSLLSQTMNTTIQGKRQ